MNADLQKLVDHLEEQKTRQAKHVPTVYHDKVLTFMATTSAPGNRAAVGICPVLRLAPGESGSQLRAVLHGPLPRLPGRGECVTVHLTNVGQYQGYQLKTRPATTAEALSALFDARGAEIEVKGAHTYTVHHSPYTMKFFEQIPFEEVQQIVGGVRYALVAVGEGANLSPRFVFHHAIEGGKLALYHGDGLALKTYANLKLNPHETRLVLDLDDYSGYQLQGAVDEFQPHQHPQAYERICEGFTAGGWGKPARVFRFAAESWQRIAPTAPATRS